MKTLRSYYIALLCLLHFNLEALAQSYTSYFTGNVVDLVTSPTGGICMMGGASENDEAMQWFLQQVNGGDVLVLRASGSDGYNNYMYSGLGVAVNSVETIVFNNASASFEPYVHQRLEQAEGIWFAGGDQWDYVSYWRNTPVDSLINNAVNIRGAVIGGTSAGMAILGGYYFSAQNGTVTSAQALNNPYRTDMTVDGTPFLQNNYLQYVITDTHYDDPDRKGRHVAFLARILTDEGVEAMGIACDEYTAVCIDTTGIAHVFGGFPTYDDNAYFLQANCELLDRTPENCTAGQPLTWDRGSEAVKVYQAKGTVTGSQTFDLNDRRTGFGGTWHNWYVNNGVLFQIPDSIVDCGTLGLRQPCLNGVRVWTYPNPTNDQLTVRTNGEQLLGVRLRNVHGQLVHTTDERSNELVIDVSRAPAGVLALEAITTEGLHVLQVLKE